MKHPANTHTKRSQKAHLWANPSNETPYHIPLSKLLNHWSSSVIALWVKSQVNNSKQWSQPHNSHIYPHPHSYSPGTSPLQPPTPLCSSFLSNSAFQLPTLPRKSMGPGWITRLRWLYCCHCIPSWYIHPSSYHPPPFWQRQWSP